MFFAKQVGRRLRQLREEQGLTQEKLAYECGRAKSHVCEIEAGKKLPSLKALAEFADRLGVRVFDFFVFPEDGTREAAVEATRGLPEPALTRLLAAARGERSG